MLSPYRLSPVPVRAAWRFEAGVRRIQAVAQSAGPRNDESFIGSPPACGEALRKDEIEPVLCGLKMFGVAVHKISLRGGVEGIHVTIGVLAGQHVFSGGKRIEVLVIDKTRGQCAVAATCAAPPCEIEIFRQCVRFIPREGHVGMRPRFHLWALKRFFRQMRQRRVRGMVQNA